MTSRLIYHPDWPLPANVGAAVTTRAAGNLASHVGDEPALVVLRRRRLQRQLGLQQPIRWLSQQHTATVSTWPKLIVPSDALVATNVGVACAVLTADCLPLLLTSADGQVVAAAHAGWRGLAQGVLENTMAAMPVPAKQLMLWVGPAICQSCFQVGDDVRQAFNNRFPRDCIEQCFRRCSLDPTKWRLNLPQLATYQAQQLGIGRENITLSNACTACDADHWFSHRRRQEAARTASIIWRKF